MKTKIALGLVVGIVLFMLGCLVMNQMVQAQNQANPYPLPVTRIIWDYDSGWISVDHGSFAVLDHNLGGDHEDYLVYMTGRDTGGWCHCAFYGMFPQSANVIYGAYYTHNETMIKIYRATNDPVWNQIRVRILRNQ